MYTLYIYILYVYVYAYDNTPSFNHEPVPSLRSFVALTGAEKAAQLQDRSGMCRVSAVPGFRALGLGFSASGSGLGLRVYIGLSFLSVQGSALLFCWVSGGFLLGIPYDFDARRQELTGIVLGIRLFNMHQRKARIETFQPSKFTASTCSPVVPLSSFLFKGPLEKKDILVLA